MHSKRTTKRKPRKTEIQEREQKIRMSKNRQEQTQKKKQIWFKCREKGQT